MAVVLFENRAPFDNVLAHVYGPKDGKVIEACSGKAPNGVAFGLDRRLRSRLM
jgi:hypothetical protein